MSVRKNDGKSDGRECPDCEGDGFHHHPETDESCEACDGSGRKPQSDCDRAREIAEAVTLLKGLGVTTEMYGRYLASFDRIDSWIDDSTGRVAR